MITKDGDITSSFKTLTHWVYVSHVLYISHFTYPYDVNLTTCTHTCHFNGVKKSMLKFNVKGEND